jgi:hypothetical protein
MTPVQVLARTSAYRGFTVGEAAASSQIHALRKAGFVIMPMKLNDAMSLAAAEHHSGNAEELARIWDALVRTVAAP